MTAPKLLISTFITLALGYPIYRGAAQFAFAKAGFSDVPNVGLSKLEPKIKSGDIIFQTSRSSQSMAVQLATHSKYSHMGIVYKNGVNYYVYEAVQPVRLTPLKKWIARGVNGRFVVKRLKNAETILNSESLKKLKMAGDAFKGKDYDVYFGWSDDKIYCSELVWKMYYNALGISVGTLKKLKDFDLSNEIVKAKLQERYGENIPLQETVVAPDDIFASEQLETVIEG